MPALIAGLNDGKTAIGHLVNHNQYEADYFLRILIHYQRVRVWIILTMGTKVLRIVTCKDQRRGVM